MILKVTTVVRLDNSSVGYPRYEVTFDNGLVGKTATNATVGYATWYGIQGTYQDVIFHYTAKGNVIITDMKPVSEFVCDCCKNVYFFQGHHIDYGFLKGHLAEKHPSYFEEICHLSDKQIIKDAYNN